MSELVKEISESLDFAELEKDLSWKFEDVKIRYGENTRKTMESTFTLELMIMSTNLLYRQHRMNNMNLESFPNEIKQLVYQEHINSEEPNSSSDKTEVVNGSRNTKETVLIFHKPNIKSPVDFDLLYGKDNKTYIEVSKNFNCRAYKWKSFKVETSRLKEIIADILKEKKRTINGLRIVLAFDYASCDCYYPVQVYRDLWSQFKEFPHYVDIIKHSREINEITKYKEQKISVLDACTRVEVNREQDPQISFNTPVFKMNNSIDPFIRSSVLFEASNTDAEAMAGEK
ncbi:hypothetical protein WICPIJ_001428 [Wickerhamomyces pijperi]|uniref:Uncharacterized protein n=1 Tax=Wickerhamomyces pijperi TaxID=599730 RepID=A0A9P8TPY5_WICPI|nr:hypothetical protein WICPIJ_001428 [Wickerhamomyces pijperi]